MSAPLQASGGYGYALLSAVIALGVLSALAYFGLRWVAARGIGMRKGKRLEVLERVPLDLKNALYVVRADGQTLLVATGDGGAPRLIQNLDTELRQTDRKADAKADAKAGEYHEAGHG